MDNLILFLNSFESYLFVYIVFIAAIVVAVAIGVSARIIISKKSNKVKVSEKQND